MTSLTQSPMTPSGVTHYSEYFDGLPTDEQNQVLRTYVGGAVQKIMHALSFPTHQDNFCMLEASRLVREDKINLRGRGISTLADEIREFLDGRQDQIFPGGQKGLLSWLDKKAESA